MRTFGARQKSTQGTQSAWPNRALSQPGCEARLIPNLQRSLDDQTPEQLPRAHEPEDKLPTSGLTHFGYDFSRIPAHSDARTSIQQKLQASTRRDSHAQEGNAGGEPALESRRTERAKADDSGRVAAPPIVHEALRSNGQPLDVQARKFIEPRFGHDLSQVRIHADGLAAKAASAIAARAFTVNRDIVFGADEYAPHTESGRRLLSHELTHVVQQQAGVHLKNGVGRAGDAYETHADAVADLVVKGKQAKPLLQQMPGAAGSHAQSKAGAVMLSPDQPVQMQLGPKQAPASSSPLGFQLPQLDLAGLSGAIMVWIPSDQARQRMAKKLAHEYYTAKHPEAKDPTPQDAQPKASKPDYSKSKATGKKNAPGGPKAQAEPTPKYDWKSVATPATESPAPVPTYLPTTTSSLPVSEPDEQRVSEAIYNSLDQITTGKGDKLTDWTLKDSSEGGESKEEEKLGDDLKNKAVDIGADFFTDKIQNIYIREVTSISINIARADLVGIATMATPGLGEAIFAFTLLIDVINLLAGGDKKSEDAEIMADVIAYFQVKEIEKSPRQYFQRHIPNPLDLDPLQR